MNGGEEYDMVNGADAGDMLDEEAEQRAFQEAVMAWRRGTENTEKGIKTLSITSGAASMGGVESSMWSNPFADVEDSEVGMGGGEDCEVLVSARGRISDDDKGPMSGRQAGGRSLAEGDLDEAKEQAVSCCW